ncbi:hypothetical protein ACIPSJ_51845 [Streptomyces sp. NPDC090088]|uniref:hypothetical protein n=1 Tax=Streptomyces sp. NPDC090088 TaxID=3365944 RepID=UPI0038306E51
MKKLMHRIAIAAVSATAVGAALVALGGTASAATLTTDQHNDRAAAVVAADRGESNGPLWDGRRDWHHERDAQGRSFWRSDNDGQHLRYDGRLYRLTHGRWVVVIRSAEVAYDFDRWYFDQLWDVYSTKHRVGI